MIIMAKVKKMKNAIIFLLAGLLVFGCIGQQEPGPVAPGNGSNMLQDNASAPDPAADAAEPEPIIPAQDDLPNGTVQDEPQPAQEVIPTTNMTVSQMVDSGLASLPSPGKGPYDIVEYRWLYHNPDFDPQVIAIGQPIDIYFSGKKESSLIGLGFKIYNDSMGDSVANGFAVVVNESSVLNPLMAGGFELDFLVPGISRELLGCSMVSKDKWITQAGNVIVVYGFECNDVRD